MKRFGLLLLMLLLWVTPAHAAITHVVTTQKQAFTDATTDPVDTTGADLLVLIVADHPSGSDGIISDSKSNTWTLIDIETAPSAVRIRIYYATNTAGKVGTNHTFTNDSPEDVMLGTLTVIAFSGAHTTAPLDVSSSAVGGSTSAQPGSVTPSVNDCVVVTGLGYSGGLNPTSVAINGSFVTPVWIDVGGSSERAGARSYWIQTTATATNPTWSWSEAGADSVSTIAVFKPAAGGGGGPTPPRTLMLLGVGGQ